MTGQTHRSTVAAFGPEPSSSGEARSFVRDTLKRTHVDETIIDRAELVVSELVTNAVLHAHCGPVVTVQFDGDQVRVEVEDASEEFPLLRNYDGDAVTGRGLAVVDASATWWGVDATETGKRVWAEFAVSERSMRSTRPETSLAPAKQSDASNLVPNEEVRVEVQYVAVPVDVYLAMEQHNEAMLREFELLNIGVDSGIETGVDAELLAIANRIRPSLMAQANSQRRIIHSAFAAGQTHVNMQRSVPIHAVDLFRQFRRLTEESALLMQAGVLLTAPPAGQVVTLRNWFVEETVRQVINGSDPLPAPVFEHSTSSR